MLLIREWRISMWMIGALRPYVNSIPSVVSLACDHCGSRIDARKRDGMSSFAFEIDLHQQKPSPSKHVVVVTSDGRLSISCACSRLDELRSHHGSGVVDGTFSSEKNSGRSCGCDPGAAHFCDEYPDCAYGQEIKKGSVRDA